MRHQKLTDRLEDILKYETDNCISNISIHPHISKKLLKFQHGHVFNMVYALHNNQVVLDGSDTGVGKTYTTIATCKQMRLKPFIICPKSIISTWRYVCNYFQVRPLAIVNYETVKLGKQYNRYGERYTSNFINVMEDSRSEYKYMWKLPRYSVIIFDEVHRCKNKKSMNAELLLSTKHSRRKVIMISATISDTPKSFHIFGYMLGLYKSMKKARNWINGTLRDDRNYIGLKKQLSTINRAMYPMKGSRIRIVDIQQDFPKNQVSADSYYIDLDKIQDVNSIYKKITKYMSVIKNDNDDSNILKKIVKTRQKLELIKVDIIIDLINEYMENNYSIAVFVNFKKTIAILAREFKTTCIVDGNHTDHIREKNIDDFQHNRTNLILLNIKTGGVGISLHDLYGKPRVSLISPSFSSIELTQTLGRIHRANSVSPSLQRIIFCANTIEEVICTHIKEKLRFTAKLNDGDLIKIDEVYRE